MGLWKEDLGELVYTSRFGDWERRSSVRSKPRRILIEENEAGKVYFPPELVAVASHDLVATRGKDAIRALTVQRLYAYLEFTAELEQLAVNPVAQVISRGRLGFDLPANMLEDAYKICTDEAWHAQFSDDLKRQVVVATGINPVLPPEPDFVLRLAVIQRRLPVEVAPLATLFFTIVSETLISAILGDIPRDLRVVSSVRELVSDHAIDEGLHHAYFSRLLDYVWRDMSGRERRAIASVLPEFVRAFLDPDYRALAASLASIGLNGDEIGTVLTDCYPRFQVDESVQEASRVTLRHFARVGAVDEPGAAEAFAAAGLSLPSR